MKKSLIAAVALIFAVAASVPCEASERFGAFTNGTPDSNLIALTFDDGPHPRYTEQILQVLAEYEIPATFFFVGENVEYYPKAAKAVAEAGHEIGNHTQSHPHVMNLSDAQLQEEILSAQSTIKRITGKTPILFRPPEGKLTTARSNLIQELGLYGVLWNIDTLDWSGVTGNDLVASVLNNVRGGDVILCHDYVSHASHLPKALRIIIPALIKKGYRFVTVSELMCREGYEVQDSDGATGGAPALSSSDSSSSVTSFSSTGGCSL